jgi:hypothetical protein
MLILHVCFVLCMFTARITHWFLHVMSVLECCEISNWGVLQGIVRMSNDCCNSTAVVGISLLNIHVFLYPSCQMFVGVENVSNNSSVEIFQIQPF